MADKPRGSYRSMYSSIDNDRDWRKLSPLSKCVFDVLKRQLGPYGIDMYALESLPRIVNCSGAQVELALEELETPKSGKDRGWIRREDDIVWIVNGLRFEPGISLDNRNHRVGATHHAENLLQLTASPVVADFMTYYGLGSDRPDNGNGAQPAGGNGVGSRGRNASPNGSGKRSPKALSEGLPHGLRSPWGNSDTETERETETERADARARSDRSTDRAPKSRRLEVIRSAPATATASARFRSIDDASSLLVEFVDRYYPPTKTDRRKLIDVERQLLALANGQAVRQAGKGKHVVSARSLTRLEAHVQSLLDTQLRSHRSAMAYLLTSLGDESDITPAGVIEHNALKLEIKRDERDRAARIRAAEAWLATTDPLTRREVEQVVDNRLEREEPNKPTKTMDLIRPMWRTIVLLELFALHELGEAEAAAQGAQIAEGGV